MIRTKTPNKAQIIGLKFGSLGLLKRVMTKKVRTGGPEQNSGGVLRNSS